MELRFLGRCIAKKIGTEPTDLPEKYININKCCLKSTPDNAALDDFCIKYGLNAIRKELAAEAPPAPAKEKIEMVQDDLFSF